MAASARARPVRALGQSTWGLIADPAAALAASPGRRLRYDGGLIRRSVPLAVVAALLALAASARAQVPEDAYFGLRNEQYRIPANWPFRPPPELRFGVGGLPGFWSDGQRCSVG